MSNKHKRKNKLKNVFLPESLKLSFSEIAIKERNIIIPMNASEKYYPKYVIISEDVRNLNHTVEILERLGKASFEYVKDIDAFISEILNSEEDICSIRNQYLFICKNRGRFYQWCPGTKKYICCGYKILHLIQNCLLDCSYCILQSYFKNPFLYVYSNLDDMFNELSSVLNKKSESLFRIGTGEFTDSLFFDHITLHSKILIPYFAKKQNAIVELKTKTNNIENLLDLAHKGHTVVSWSVNSEKIAQEEEPLAVSIDERIKSAEMCQDFGYKIGFHFDPIIHYYGWEKDYKKVIEKIFLKIKPENIAWISIGCLRFMPSLKLIIQKRFSNSKIIYEEFIIAEDGKMRYLKPLRVHIYKTLYEYIREISHGVPVYLCMEREDVWENALGLKHFSSKKLTKMLDESVFTKVKM